MKARTTELRQTVARKRFGVWLRYDRIPKSADRPQPCPPVAQLLEDYARRGSAPDVLYLGGSESFVVSWNDWSPKPLARMVRKRLKPSGMCEITHIAYHSGVYRALLRALLTMPKRPRTIIFPINIRQTSPQWCLNPNLRFDELIASIETYAADPEGGLPIVTPFPRFIHWAKTAPDEQAWERFQDTAVSYSGRPERTIREFNAISFSRPRTEQEQLDRFRAIWAYHYLHPVEEDHERLKWLRDIFPLGEELGCELIGWMHPVNHERGHELLGSAMDESVAAHVEAAWRACGPRARVLDWSKLLPARCFFDSVEHFNEEGRRIVADEMLRAIREVTPPKRVSR